MTFKYLLVTAGLFASLGLSAADPVETRAHYSTNSNNAVGKAATITIDGEFNDWTEDMIVATCGANDMCTTFSGSHENCVVDLYALYAAWDDNNLYIAWQCVNTGDTWARPGDGPLTDGGRIGDVPFILTLSLDPSSTGMSGKLENGNCIWRDNNNSGVTFSSHVDRIFYMSAKAGQGEPGMFKAVNSNGDTNYGAGCTTFKNAGIRYAMKFGFHPSHLWRQRTHAEWANVGELISDPSIVNNIYDPECYDNLLAGPVEGLKEHSSEFDTFYEISIPLSVLGIDRQWLEANGIGARVVGTRGESGIDCVPHDPSMVDNIFEPYAKDPSTSHEKDDFDNITYALADIAKIRDIANIDPLPNPEPNPTPTPTPDPTPVSGNMNVYLTVDGCNWNAVNAYIWDAGNGNKEYAGKWPGSATVRKAIDGKEYYQYSFDTTDNLAKPMIIFNGGGQQTADWEYVNNGVYTLGKGFTGETLKPQSGVTAFEASEIKIHGRTISAPGLISVYNLQGVKIAEGFGSADVPDKGLYIISASGMVMKHSF